MKPIRIAQIGVNRYSHGPDIIFALRKFPELFEVVGYALVEDEAETCKNKMKDYAGLPLLTLDEILEDESIEAVAVETDEIHLTKYAKMVITHGKHLHMEKPGSQDEKAFEELIELAKKSGKVFHLGYMYRYNEYVKDAIERAKKGELGRMISVEADMSRRDGEDCRRWLSSFRGGMMFYLGCHLIDLILLTMGTPTAIHAFNRSTGVEGIDSEDGSLALLEYPTGISSVRVYATEVGGFLRRRVVFSGTEGCIEIQPLERSIPGIRHALTTSKKEYFIPTEKNPAEYTTDVFCRYDAMIKSFASYVRGEKVNPYTPDYELTLFRTLLRCCGM